MKKLIALLFVLSCLLVCAACSGPAETATEVQQTQDPDYTPQEMTFEHVQVPVTGLDILEQRDFMITGGLEESLKDVTLVASVPLKQVYYVDASAFDPCLDLSSIKSAGDHELKISYKKLDPDYGRVISVTPESVMIHVEETLVRRVPVSVKSIGNVPDGWNVSVVSCDPLYISVRGIKDTIRTIIKAGTLVDLNALEWNEGVTTTICELKLYNSAGEEVDDPLLKIYSEDMDTEIDSASIMIEISAK